MGNRNRRNRGYSSSRSPERGYDDVSRYRRDSQSSGRSRDARGDSESERYSRSATRSRYSGQLSKQRKRHKILRNVLITVAVVLALGVGAAFAYVGILNGNLQNGLDSGLKNVLVKTNLTKEPFYMLLMGTDESLERNDDNSTQGTYRTDTIILARIDPVNKQVTLVSMPRDTMVTLTGYGTQKLNAAYALGGSSMAVSTVAGVAGVNISHFGLIDMDGLQEVVDALGGIEVEVPMTIDDADAGGHLDAGLQTLNGEQALILCRARHAYDEYGDGDEYRSANQRLVLQAIANKILTSDVATIATTVTTLSNYVSTDLSVNDIVGLAQALSGMDTENSLYTAAMPTTSVYQNELWYEKIDETAWKAMMKRVDAGESPTEATQVDAYTGTVLSSSGDSSSGSTTDYSSVSKSGTIVVRNGTGTTGLAQTVANALTKVGYTVSDTGNADAYDYAHTLVIYNTDGKATEAKAIASTLGSSATAQANDGSYLLTGDFLVIIGSDYSG